MQPKSLDTALFVKYFSPEKPSEIRFEMLAILTVFSRNTLYFRFSCLKKMTGFFSNSGPSLGDFSTCFFMHKKVLNTVELHVS